MTQTKNMTEARNQRHVQAEALGVGQGDAAGLNFSLCESVKLGGINPPAHSVIIEPAGQTRRDGQSLNDRLREIKSLSGWINAEDLREPGWGGDDD